MRPYLKRMIILIITAILSFNSFGQYIETKDKEEYKVETEIFKSHLLQSQLIQEEVFAAFTASDIENLAINDDNEILYQKYSKFLDEKSENNKITEEQKRTLYKLLRDKVRHIFRQYGIGLATIYFGIVVAEQVFFVIFLNAGLPSVALVMQTFPFADTFLLVSLQLKYLIKRQKIINSFGGKKNYKLVRKLEKELKQFYGLKSKNSILAKLQDDEEYNVVTIEKDTIINQTSSLLRLNKQRMTLKNLLLFCKDEKVLEGCKDSIKSKENQLKKIDVINFLFSTTNKDLIKRFEIKFGQFFRQIREFYSDPKLANWALRLIKAESLNEVRAIFENTVLNISVFSAFELLKNQVIPCWLEDMDDVKYGEFRRFYKNFEKVELQSHKSPTENWSEVWIEKLFNF